MDLSSLAKRLLQQASTGETGLEKGVPAYGQLQRGIRQTMAPVMGQNASKYMNTSQPEQPGIVNAGMRMLGQQVPFAPLMAAGEGVAAPIIAKALQAKQAAPAAAQVVNIKPALQFLESSGNAVPTIVNTVKGEPDNARAINQLIRMTNQHLPDFKTLTPPQQADIWDSLLTVKNNPGFAHQNREMINPALRPTIESMYAKVRGMN